MHLYKTKIDWILGGFEYLRADDVEADPGAGGATFRTDQLGTGQHVPYTKLMSGTADDAAVIPGDATNGLFVQVKTSAAVPVTDNSASLTVDNAGTFAVQAAQSGTWTVQPGNTANTTAWKVDASSVAVPITDNSGSLTTDFSGQKTLDYDTGAGTDTVLGVGILLPASGGAVAGGTATNPIQVSLANTASNSTAVRVDGSGATQPVSGTVTANAGTGTFTAGGVAAHDAAVSGNPVLLGGYASASAPTNVSADGDAVRLWADLAGRLQVGDGGSTLSVDDGSGSLTVDYATTGSGTATGALRVELPTNGTGVIATVGAVTAITNALPAGTNAIGKLAANSGVDIGDVDVTSGPTGASAFQVQGTAAADAAVVGNPVIAGGRASAAAPTDMSADGDAVSSWHLRNGAQAVQPTFAGILQSTGNGTAGTGTPRVTIASDNTAFSVNATATGAAAHDAAVSGNPVRGAGQARTSDYTAVANGDTADFVTDLNGKQIVLPYAIPENSLSGVTSAITGTSDTSVIAAQGAGIRIYVTQILVTNSHASTGTVVEIKDNTTVIYRGYAAPAGGGFALTFPVPLRLAANVALQAANVTNSSNTYVSASGYKAP